MAFLSAGGQGPDHGGLPAECYTLAERIIGGPKETDVRLKCHLHGPAPHPEPGCPGAPVPAWPAAVRRPQTSKAPAKLRVPTAAQARATSLLGDPDGKNDALRPAFRQLSSPRALGTSVRAAAGPGATCPSQDPGGRGAGGTCPRWALPPLPSPGDLGATPRTSTASLQGLPCRRAVSLSCAL